MGFMGYSTAKLKERAEKRGMTLEQYCKELELRLQDKKRNKAYAKLPKTD